jgi:Acetyltransferase (GNAT) domain
MHIEVLSPATESAYTELLLSIPSSMLFQSVRYRNLLAALLPGAKDNYFLAFEGSQVVGALPAFVKDSLKCGKVMNSLPFFGSNGGILVRPGQPRAAIGGALLDAFVAFADSEKMVSSTVVSHPLENDFELYRKHLAPTLEDERIGQITPLPQLATYEGSEAEKLLMDLYHVKTRNVVRKAQSSDVHVTHEGTEAAMRALYAIHEENMTSIGGVVKPWSVFESIRACFQYDEDYRVYLAKKNDQVIAGLLVLYFNRITEYFTPVTKAEYRGIQPQSLLCLTAMKDAMQRGHSHWNWGGTGLTQTGVYEFKRKWGTEDHRYRYFIREAEGKVLRGFDKATLAAEYPNFFSIPFSVLG